MASESGNPYMTVEQIIRFMRPLYPRWRQDLERRYLDMFELPPKLKIPKLSKGMRSKLMLLLAISRGAELLILDEPMEGLDPSANVDVLKELVELAAECSLRQLLDVGEELDMDRLIEMSASPLIEPVDINIPLPDMAAYDALLEEVTV
jgi:ABC-type multidrug transport system ATPase subunit